MKCYSVLPFDIMTLNAINCFDVRWTDKEKDE